MKPVQVLMIFSGVFQKILANILLTLLDFSGLFIADRTGFANESQDDGTQSFSLSEELLSSNISSAESPSTNKVFNFKFYFWFNPKKKCFFSYHWLLQRLNLHDYSKYPEYLVAHLLSLDCLHFDWKGYQFVHQCLYRYGFGNSMGM